jgi:hypothetical protein
MTKPKSDWTSLVFPLPLSGGYPALGIITLAETEWQNLRANLNAQRLGIEGPTEAPIEVIGRVVQFQDPAPDALPLDACSIPLHYAARGNAVRCPALKAPHGDLIRGDESAVLTAEGDRFCVHWKGWSGLSRSPWLPAPALAAGRGWTHPVGV